LGKSGGRDPSDLGAAEGYKGLPLRKGRKGFATKRPDNSWIVLNQIKRRGIGRIRQSMQGSRGGVLKVDVRESRHQKGGKEYFFKGGWGK